MKRICHLFSRKKKDPFSTGRYIQKETHHPSLKESIGAFFSSWASLFLPVSNGKMLRNCSLPMQPNWASFQVWALLYNIIVWNETLSWILIINGNLYQLYTWALIHKKKCKLHNSQHAVVEKCFYLFPLDMRYILSTSCQMSFNKWGLNTSQNKSWFQPPVLALP